MGDSVTRLTGAETVFEFGSGFGYSAYWVAPAVGPGGAVVLTEVDADKLADAREYFRRGGYADHARFELGDAVDTVGTYDDPVDLALLDHENHRYVEGFEAVRETVPVGGAVVADDVLHSSGDPGFAPVDLDAAVAGTPPDDSRELAGVADYYRHVRGVAEFGLAEGAGVPGSIDDDRLREVLDEHDLGLAVHLPFKQDIATPVAEINEAIVVHQDRLLAWAGKMGAREAVLHATVRNPHDTDQRPVFADQLSRIVEAGAEHDVEVVVENVGHQARGLPLSVLGEVAEETDVPVCFGVGHAYMEDGNDGIEQFLKGYADRVSHLHVHDVRGRGDTHMPLGAGAVDYGLVAEYLGGFDGTVAVEVFTDDVALLEDSARRVADVLEGSV
jgi:predicted O-methyltransferase YrrM